MISLPLMEVDKLLHVRMTGAVIVSRGFPDIRILDHPLVPLSEAFTVLAGAYARH